MTRKPRCAGSVRFEKEGEFIEETAAQRWRRRLAIGGSLLLLSGGAAGWWLGDIIGGMMGAVVLSAIGTGAAMYMTYKYLRDIMP